MTPSDLTWKLKVKFKVTRISKALYLDRRPVRPYVTIKH